MTNHNLIIAQHCFQSRKSVMILLHPWVREWLESTVLNIQGVAYSRLSGCNVLFMNISVIGTGYVGLVQGVILADFGLQVTCMDVDQKKIDRLKAGEVPIYEPGLAELMHKKRGRRPSLLFIGYEGRC